MTERTQFPNSPACGAWETLLADALDGLLKPEDEAQFAAHKATCPACAALYEEAQKGREWLEFLSPEPEAPAGLLEKILAQTGPGHKAALPMPALAGAGTVPGICTRRFGSSRVSLPGRGQAMPTAAADDGGDGVLLNRAHVEPDWSAAVDSAVGRSAAGGGAVVYGAAVEHGLGAHRSVLRPFAVCVRSGIAECGNCAARAKAMATRTQRRKQPGPETGAAGDTRRDETESREERWRGSRGPSTAAGQFSGTAGVRRHADDFVETSFHLHGNRGRSDSSARRAREGSKVWIA